MSKKRNEKRITTLESFFENILVCNDRDLRPFIETFHCEAENIEQEKLGTLFGIMEITDDSEESSYVVNYLISVIRKEYFSKPKRGAVESLEAALHKANLALSKLAEHGSLAWLGKLHSIVAVIEKNNLHLSQAGQGLALLLRNKNLTDIGEGLSEENTEPHPLKTFVNVLSGRLEDEDKLILTSSEIFEIFSFEEIKKSALRFSQEDFNQFLRTALSNEVSKAAIMVVNLKEKEEIVEMQPQATMATVNVFSQTAFSKKSSRLEEHVIAPEEETISSKTEPANNGHLYIKETPELPQESEPRLEFFSSFREKISVFIPSRKMNAPKKENSFHFAWKEYLKKIIFWLKVFFSQVFFLIWKGSRLTAVFVGKIFQIIFFESKTAWEKRQAKKEFLRQENFSATLEKNPNRIYLLWNKIIPHFSFIGNFFRRLNKKQKIYLAITFLVFFVILPITFNVLWKVRADRLEAERLSRIVPPAPLPLAEENNVTRLEKVDIMLEIPDVKNVSKLNGTFFALSEKEIFNLGNQEKYALPEELGKADLVFPMEDLNLLLLFNKENGKIFSFSPLNKKFQANNLVLPEGASISAGGTYLTYLYLVDQKANQIYRYPRAEGGFGEKADWKKDATEIKNTSSIALNENLFLTDNTEIWKFFRGKKQDFNLEKTALPLKPFRIYTELENPNLYVLDQENSRFVKYNQEGKIVFQYYHPSISGAENFSVDETAKKIIFADSERVITFNWQ